jgi:GntR family transcriptional regulator
MAALFFVDDKDPRPLYQQLAAQVKAQIRKGTLQPGEELPSVRELSSTLGINLHTVHHAYRTLREEGIVLLRLGRRPRVAPRHEGPPAPDGLARLRAQLGELVTEGFHLGLSPKDFRALVDDLLATDRGKR